jgi:hypothetical protein
MTVVLPDPVPLDLPAENLAAVEDLVRQVALAGYRQGVVGDGLSGPAASAPGWLGDDARAAAAQVVAVLDLVRSCQGALLTVATRVRAHGELLAETRATITRLRSDQHSDFAAAWGRLAALPNYVQAALTDAPEMQAIADEVRSADQARRNRHAVLIDELAADAAATARVLAESSAAVGGRAQRGDTNTVIVSLAARLPGWGDEELAARGRALAARLLGTPLDGAGLDASAADTVLFADRPAFAEAFLVALGPKGVRALLRTLGGPLLGPVNSLSQVLATAMATAATAGWSAVDQVLHARYLAPSAEVNDAVAGGMAAVLLAGSRGPSGGVPTETVAEWARQLTLYEHARSAYGSIVTPMGWGYPLNDPLGVAVSILATRHAVDSSAQLLADPVVWQTVLAHIWGDGGVGLSGVIAAAGQAPGEAGDAAIRAGLTVIGDGLPLGDPVHWTVNRATVGQIKAALGTALAGHLDVAFGAMSAAVGGWITDSDRALLRGLGTVSLDCAAVLAIGQALAVRSMAYVLSPSTRRPALALPVVLAPAAWTAVQQYGRMLDYTLDGYEKKADAEARATLYQGSYGQLAHLPGWIGPVAGIAVAYGARALDADGTWNDHTPQAPALDAGDAMAAVTSASGIAGPYTQSAADRTEQVYDRTQEALGIPVPPASPVIPFLQPLWDQMGFGIWDAVHNPRGRLDPGLLHVVPK